ncbi:hypothetical protein TNCT_501561 [Trichonephila clavata]|uniref:Uncharacterized protein n=1 Tax=Trichonephila clavata TaxID=2740835 RepID=A0A8X6LLV7_TRICU|nr:hypothetical protein TNCT_501561 [Trichonephila clavata]
MTIGYMSIRVEGFTCNNFNHSSENCPTNPRILNSGEPHGIATLNSNSKLNTASAAGSTPNWQGCPCYPKHPVRTNTTYAQVTKQNTNNSKNSRQMAALDELGIHSKLRP